MSVKLNVHDATRRWLPSRRKWTRRLLLPKNVAMPLLVALRKGCNCWPSASRSSRQRHQKLDSSRSSCEPRLCCPRLFTALGFACRDVGCVA